MTLQKGTLNGVSIIEDSSAVGTPVTNVSQDGGDIIAENAAIIASRRSAHVVNTVADLASLASPYLVDGQTYATLGYNTVRDGGSNVYTYSSGSSATVDGGFVINGPGGVGRFLAVDQNIADVKKFGAVGDGVVNDTTALQAAIDSLLPVYFPAGTYLTSSLTLAADALITGDNAILTGTGTKTGTCLNIVPTADIDIKVDGLRITNYELPIYFSATETEALTIKVTNCQIDTCKRGIWCVANVVRADIVGNWIYDIIHGSDGTGAIVLGDLIDDTYEDTSGNYFVHGNKITNVDSGSANESHAIWVTGIGAEISSNRIESVESTSIGNGAEAIYTKCRYVRVLSNYIVGGGHGQGAIVTKGTKRGSSSSTPLGFGSTIANNHVIGTVANNSNIGIYANCSDTHIHHNRIEQMIYHASATDGGAGIYVPNSEVSNVSIEHNQIFDMSCRHGIFCRTTGSNIRVDNNSIENIVGHASDTAAMFGILFQPTDDTDTVYCRGNVIRFGTIVQTGSAIRGIRFLGTAAKTYANWRFSDNTIHMLDDLTTSTGLEVVPNATSVCDRWVISGNQIDGIYDTDFSRSNTATFNAYREGLNSWNIGDFIDSETVTTATPALTVYGATQIDSSSNAVDATLGSGTYIGQRKTIVMTDATNSSTVSVTNHVTSDPEVFIFNAVDEALSLEWTGTEWVTIYATATT